MNKRRRQAFLLTGEPIDSLVPEKAEAIRRELEETVARELGHASLSAVEVKLIERPLYTASEHNYRNFAEETGFKPVVPIRTWSTLQRYSRTDEGSKHKLFADLIDVETGLSHRELDLIALKTMLAQPNIQTYISGLGNLGFQSLEQFASYMLEKLTQDHPK